MISNKSDGVSTTNIQQLDVPPSKRKRDTVSAACERCRFRKIKCDGRRPRCVKCTNAQTNCVYTVHDGQTRQDATKARYEKLEEDFTSMRNVLDRLRKCSITEADQMLQHMRKCDDPITFAQTVSSQLASPSTQPKKLLARKDLPDLTINASSVQSDVPDDRASKETKDTNFKVEYNNQEYTDDKSMVSLGLQTDILGHIRIPGEKHFRAATQAFHECSGMLFHVCDHERIEWSFDSVFRSQGQPCNPTALCRISSMAAVGSLYMVDKDAEDLRDTFYLIARLLLDSCIESDPLEAMAYCALIAMYNVLSRATVALVYIQLGMSLCRQHQIHKIGRPSTMSEEDWFRSKRAWRVLVFFGAWISSTYGRHSGNEWDLPPDTDVQSFEPSSDMKDTVQIQMVKIAVLKRNILRVNIADPQSDCNVETVSRDLREWYASLPKQMQLVTLLVEDGATYLEGELRRIVYFVHLLYLGALMLLYRRVAMQIADRVCDASIHESVHASLNKLDSESTLAAEQVARILSLLLDENAIVERCWIVVYQAFSAGTLLLRRVTQTFKRTQPSDNRIEEVLAHAETCLRVLSKCSKDDPIARKFEESLRTHYNNLAFLSTKATNASQKLRKAEIELYQLVLSPFDHITQADVAETRIRDVSMALHSHMDWADSYRMESSWDRAAAKSHCFSPLPQGCITTLDKTTGVSVNSMVHDSRPLRDGVDSPL